MPITNQASGTRIDEIADGIYRINTPIRQPGGGFSFNQYLVVDDEPLLYHTGPRSLFAPVSEAIASVMPLERLRFVGFSHFEADECGALNLFLAAAPSARPLCGQINAMVNADAFDRPPLALGDGAELPLGRRRVRWLDAPHLPHSWECGHLMEEQTRTLFCSDLFTQPGSEHAPLTSGDILGPSEAFRQAFDYYSHTKRARPLLEKLAAAGPTTLACMHGSAWQGDGAGLLRALAEALDAPASPP